MRRFKDLLKSKFVWGPKDVDHEKKPKKESAQQRSLKFIWKDGDLEHHELKESLDEHKIPADVHGNFGKPHQHKVDYPDVHGHHPLDKPSHKTGHGEPEEGDDSHEAFLAHHESLSGDEEDSVRHYKDNGYSDINHRLRTAHKKFKKEREKHFKSLEHGLKYKEDDHKDLKQQKKLIAHSHKHDDDDNDEPSEDDYHDHEHENHVYHLDNVTNHRTVEHHVVFRGGVPGDKKRFPIGHEYTDHGYASTSFRREKAKNFAKSHSVGKDKSGYDKLKDHVHVIHVPKGSRGHYLDVMGTHSAHEHSGEKEFLLHRGTRFKVTHHSEDGNTHYIHSRVVKQGVRHKYKFTKKQAPEPKDTHGLPGQQKFPFMKHHKRFK